MGNFLSSKRDFQRSIGILIFEQSWGWDLGDEVNPPPILGGWDDFFPHVGRWRGAVGAH